MARIMAVITNPELILLYRRAIDNVIYGHPGAKGYQRTGAMKHPQAFRLENSENRTTIYLDDEKVAEINRAVSGREGVMPYAWRWENSSGKHPGFMPEAKKMILLFLIAQLNGSPNFKVHVGSYGMNHQMRQGPSRAPLSRPQG